MNQLMGALHRASVRLADLVKSRRCIRIGGLDFDLVSG